MDPAPSFVEAFKENPIFIFLAIVFALLALVAGGIALIVRSKGARIGLGLAAALLALSGIGAGAFGTLRGRSNTDMAAEAPGLSARDRERITTLGYAEANYNLMAGLSAIPGGALGLVAVVLAIARKSNVKA